MKKTETITKYYCDYCGSECSHTPDLHLPYRTTDGIKANGRTVVSFTYTEITQKDVCIECIEKIANLLELLPNISKIDKSDDICMQVGDII